MKTRYSFGGDEHIFVECDEEMSLEAFFKSLSVTKAVRAENIKGVTEICPANASYQIKFDPDVIKPDDLLAEIKRIEAAAAGDHGKLSTRIIEIPVLYNDPWTRETLMRFRVLRSTFFDFEALTIPTLVDGQADIVIAYQMGAMAEEAASYQTMGFFERLLELGGATNVYARFEERSWLGDERTRLDITWDA